MLSCYVGSRPIKSIIDKLKANGKDAFEITQLINSMLGLLVFPQQEFVKKIPRIPLADLKRDGWPIPRVVGDFQQVRDLKV